MKLLSIRTLKSLNLSEFQAAKWLDSHKHELVTTQVYELGRTKTDILYVPSKKEKYRRRVLETRVAALLAKRYGKMATTNFETHTIKIENKIFKIADRVHSGEELAYHSSKGLPISLTQTTLCPQFIPDNETIKNYYASFKFPSWFLPYIKQRHFRYALINSRFIFQTRSYNEKPNKPAYNNMRFDIARHAGQICKAYFSLNRMLNPVKEKHGKGTPLGIFYLAFDIDAEKHEECRISPNGLCQDCIDSSTEKLEKFKQITDTLPNFKIENVLFSGSKGWHVHCSYNTFRELGEKEFIMLNHYILTQDPTVIDNFILTAKNGKPYYDKHRVMRIPNSADAQTGYLIQEELERLPLKDNIQAFKY